MSALVDGQLDPQSAERAWEHVLTCPPCRRLVEHEGWVKRQLAQITEAPRADQPSDQLLGSLLGLDPGSAWPETPWSAPGDPESDELLPHHRVRRRAGIALAGAGSVSAAVLGLTTLGGVPLAVGTALGGGGGTPASSLGGSGASTGRPGSPAQSTVPPTRAVVAPTGAAQGRLRGWTVGAGADGVAHAHAVHARR